jgi:hypothetical protein
LPVDPGYEKTKCVANELVKIDTTINGIALLGDRYPEVQEKK